MQRRYSFLAALVCALTVMFGTARGEVMMQWFETDWDEMYQKLPRAALAGYDSLWVPPPTKAPIGASTKWANVGYNLYDRFDIGDVPQRGTLETRYGSRGSLRAMVDNAHNLGIKIIPDIVMNHNANGPDFREYPGMRPTDFHVQWQEGYVNTLNFKRAPRMDQWYHNEGYGGTMWMDLAGLADIRTEDHPLNGDPKRFTGEKYGFNFVDGTSYFRHIGQYDLYPYAYTNELASEMLYRWIVWLGNAMDYDGLRLDAGKHVPYEFFGWKGSGFLHEAQWNYTQRRGYNFGGNPSDLFANDRDRTNAFIFAEILSPWSEIEYWYGQGNRNPMRFLDYGMKKTADGAFTGNMGGLGAYGSDFGPNAGVAYVWGHDEGPPGNSKINMAYAYILSHVGVPMVYYTGNNITWDNYGRGAYDPGNPTKNKTWMIPGYDSHVLGEGSGNPGAIMNLVWLNQNFARGGEWKRWDNDGDFFALERFDDLNGNGQPDSGEGIMVLALNDTGSDMTKNLDVSFPNGTVLKDYTGNNMNQVTVSGGKANITVPGNGGQGWVVYAPLSADGLVISVKDGASAAGTVAWVHPSGEHANDLTQEVLRVTNNTVTIEGLVTQVPSGINVDNLMMQWGGGRQLPVTNWFDQNRGRVSGRFHNMNRNNATNYSLTFSTTNLPEGLNIVKVRAFTERPSGYSAIYNTQSKVIYVDRHGPDLVLDVPSTFKGDAVLHISNPDFTAYEVFVKVDGGSEVKADMVMKGTFRYALTGLSAGSHTITVRATEYNYASTRTQINQSTSVTSVTAQAKDAGSLALAIDDADKTPGDNIAELPFFKVIASGHSGSAKLYWDGYELPWNGGNGTNIFNGEIVRRDNQGRVETNRLWGNFVNGPHIFELRQGSDVVAKRVVFNLYGANHVDSDGDGLPDNVEIPYFDQGAPGPDQFYPGDSNGNFVPDPGESWGRLNPYNHSTFFSTQWDDRNDFDGDGFSNGEEVRAGYFEDGNAYKYNIYSASSKPSGPPGTQPSSASAVPGIAVPGENITITYSPNDGALKSVGQVVMHVGHSKRTMGSWQDVLDISMSKSGTNWTAVYAVSNNATSVDVTFFDGGSTWDGRDWQFQVAGASSNRFVMDAALDSSAYEIAEYNGMKLWAAVRGTKLYVATWGTGPYSGITNDHFIMIGKDIGDATPNPWVKQGYTFLGTNFLYLGAEGGNQWSGWFNSADPNAVSSNSNLNGTYNYLEGEIDLVDQFGSTPAALYIAVGVFAGNDGDPMVAQVPARWGDNNSNIEVTELLRVPLASIRDEDGDGNFDGGSPMLWTVVNGNTNDANYGLRRFFLDELRNDQEQLTVILQPNAGGTNVVTAVELFSNLNRRDRAKLPGDEDPNDVTTTSLDTYYLAYTMNDIGGGRYSVTVPVNRTGVYRINARYKINNGPWRYYTDNGLRRDTAVVVSPKKALDTTVYELNPLTAEAKTDQFAGRSTFRNMYLDDNDRPNGISTNKLKQLGVNMVWLQPIHPIGTVGRDIDPSTSLPYDPGSPYAVKDYWQVNPVLGTDNTAASALQEFTNFVHQYDANGIGVMLDGTFNHSAWDAQVGQMAVEMDLKNNQGVTLNPSDLISSVRVGWYSKRDSYGEPATYFNSTGDTDIAVAPDRFDFGKWNDAADFLFGKYDALVQKAPANTNWTWSSGWSQRYLREDDRFEGYSTDATRELWEYFANYPIYWLEKTGHPVGTPKSESYKGIDGLRCDFAQGLPNQFWEYAINKTRTVKWDFLFMAESLDGYSTVNGSNRHGVGYRSARQFDILNENILYLWRNDFFNYRTYPDQTNSNPNRKTGVIFNAFDVRKNAFEMSPVLLNLVSHDEIFPTDDQWSLAYAYAINGAMDGVPMLFYGQESGAQNDYTNYNARSDFGIDAKNNFARYELNFGKSIPHFKRYNHMTNIWNASWSSQLRATYNRINWARMNSPALRSQQNYFLADKATTNWNPDIFAVAKFQKPGVSAATQDVVFAFVNNDFRANQSRAASFKVDATVDGNNWFGINPTHLYNVVDIASTNPVQTLWPSNYPGSKIISEGIYVGFHTNASFYGGQVQYIRLLDITAGMTPTNVNDMFRDEPRLAPPVLTGLSNRSVNVSNTLSFAVTFTKEPADVVTLSVQSTLAPDHWSFSGTNFTFSPVASEIGPHSFLFKAQGIDGFDEKLITITVLPQNQDPTAYEQWAQDNGVDPDGPNGAPTEDYDNDGITNEEEFWADTSPTNSASFPQIKAITLSGQTVNVQVDKAGVSPRIYVIHSATGLVGNAFGWSVLGTNNSTTGILPINNPDDPVKLFKVTVYPQGQ
ncbi:MAG: alpha-amylase family glycosyl hydrolase [Kiritimatiellae bacterium]|nr:alpha-amylase family glycosyl hydrolase [Kiritimatiellia bacterium]